MKLFRSSLRVPKRTSIIAILTAGCVTSSWKQDELTPYVRSEGFYSPYRSEIQALCKEKCSEDILFKFYCSKGKQKRKLTTRFLAILGKPPRGISVEEAAKIRKKSAESMKTSIGNFYLRGLVDAKTVEIPVSDMVLTGLPSNDFSDLKNGFKSIRTEKTVEPVFVKTEKNSDPVLVVMARLPRYEATYGNVVKSKGNLVVVRSTRSEYAECSKAPVCGLFEPCNDSKNHDKCSKYINGSLFALVDGRKLDISKRVDNSFVKQTDESIYPLRKLTPFETNSFSSEYTMLIPAETQTELFGGALFVREDGTFDLEQAVNSRSKIWEAYIKRLSTVTEAQDKDPDLTRYEVTLNLEPFCAYGRRVDDILTK